MAAGYILFDSRGDPTLASDWKVKYDDGDEESFNLAEIKKYRKKWEGPSLHLDAAVNSPSAVRKQSVSSP